jgi:hypothetical protein
LQACRKQQPVKDNSQLAATCEQTRIHKFIKSFKSSVQIILTTMRMLNSSSLFSYPCDNSCKEEILPYLHYYLNLNGIFYVTGS